jgi:hypothetical protein
MGYRPLLALFVLCVAAPPAHAQGLEDFARFSRAIGKEVSVVDVSGLVREGVVEAVTADEVALRVRSGTLRIPRADVVSAERLKDESSDGAYKGALWALLLALVPNQGATSVGQHLRAAGVTVVVFATIGYVLDASEVNRQPLYRAPATTAPAITFSVRF